MSAPERRRGWLPLIVVGLISFIAGTAFGGYLVFNAVASSNVPIAGSSVIRGEAVPTPQPPPQP